MSWKALVAFERALLEEAEKLSKNFLAIRRDNRKKYVDNMDVVIALSVQARVASARNIFEDAQRLCRESLGMVTRWKGSKSKDTEIAKILHVSAGIQFNQGKLRDAVDSMERALEMYQNRFTVSDHHE